jgi:putative transposase
MSRKRRLFSGSFKAKVALAAIRGDRSTAELASQFAVHASQVAAWKKQLLGGAPELFEDGRISPRGKEDRSAREEELYEQIGRRKVEVEWLKKKAAELG